MKRDNIKKIAINMVSQKFKYSPKELSTMGWTTIGGRIEDFVNTVKDKGTAEAYKEIKSTYLNNADEVFRGLQVYMIYGTNAYYDEDLGQIKHPENKKYFK